MKRTININLASKQLLEAYASGLANVTPVSKENISNCIEFYIDKLCQSKGINFEEYMRICVEFMGRTLKEPNSFLGPLLYIYSEIDFGSVQTVICAFNSLLRLVSKNNKYSEKYYEEMKEFLPNHAFGVRNAQLVRTLMDNYNSIFYCNPVNYKLP